MSKQKDRREFIGELTTAAAFTALASHINAPAEAATSDMPYRTLGHTGEKVSLIGLGGSHIGKQKDENESIAIIRSALDRGVNFLDNCYHFSCSGFFWRMACSPCAA